MTTPADHGSLQMKCRFFRGGAFTTWEQVFADAANFATEQGPDRVVNISHSDNDGLGVVTVWYWASPGEE